MVRPSWLLVCALAATVGPGTPILNGQETASAPAKGSWTITGNYAVKETADDNVFLQDLGDTARKRSLVTSGSLGITLGYQRTPAFNAAFSWAGELVRFHRFASENHLTHRVSANFNGTSGNTSWEFTNAVVRINGSRIGPSFDVANGGDIPALGGIPLRDRRDALVLRHGFKLTQTRGNWFLRPVLTFYLHDFRTEQRARIGPNVGYENYVDRHELSGGVDLGRRIGDTTWVVFGHRLGRQEQGGLLGQASPYSNRYNRVLMGVEGTPVRWLKFNVLVGPDIRRFEKPPASFDADKTLWFVNSSVSWVPAQRDTITVALSRFQQPAFSSQSMYEDTIGDVTWRRRYTERLSATVGLKLHRGDWQAPVKRDDWVLTPTAVIGYTFNPRLIAEVAYAHDFTESRIANTEGREFTRNLLSVSVRGSF